MDFWPYISRSQTRELRSKLFDTEGTSPSMPSKTGRRKHAFFRLPGIMPARAFCPVNGNSFLGMFYKWHWGLIVPTNHQQNRENQNLVSIAQCPHNNMMPRALSIATAAASKAAKKFTYYYRASLRVKTAQAAPSKQNRPFRRFR